MLIRRCLATISIAAALAAAAPAWAVEVTVLNLVSDDATAHPASITDPSLVNAWGVSFSATSPFWVSNNGTGTATLYNVNPTTQVTSKVALTVTIPDAGSVTGQVFNPGAGFNSDRFLFVSEDGTISGWRGALGTTAERFALPDPSNIYKGAALATVGGNAYLLAANFGTGAIDVLKGSAAAPDLASKFVDPATPSGYAPFNIQNLGGMIYVTYALKGAGADEVAGAGLGIVSRFDLNGNFVGRVATFGALDAPWGLAIAPTSYGALAGALLVGNFGDGRVTAYDLATDAMLGQLLDDTAAPLEIDGLWALTPGNDGGAGSSDKVYFTSGPDGETHGLFGVLSVVPGTEGTPPGVPEPGNFALVVAAALALGLTTRRG